MVMMGNTVKLESERLQAYVTLLSFALVHFADIAFHQHWGKTHHQQKDYDSLKAQAVVNIF